MALLVTLNLHESKDGEFEDFPPKAIGANRADLFLTAAFNKLPADITAENIAHRKYRCWLLRITEETNSKVGLALDVMDIFLRLGQLRKAGKLKSVRRGDSRNKTENFEECRDDELRDPTSEDSNANRRRVNATDVSI